MSFTDYCSTGQSLYHKLAMTFMNVETGEEYSEEYLRETFDKEHPAAVARLEEHIKTCAQCSLSDSEFDNMRARSAKKLPQPVM
jgi:hypothetical protein